MNLTGLNKYIRENKHRKFCFCKHDCLTFTNEVWEILYGHKWSPDWLGRYGAFTRPDALQKEYGFKALEDAIDSKLRRVEGIPPKGALVVTRNAKNWSTGLAMGISVGGSGLFLSETGMVNIPIEDCHMGWVE